MGGVKRRSVLAKEIGITITRPVVFQLNYKKIGFWGIWVSGFFWLIQVLNAAILILIIGIYNMNY